MFKLLVVLNINMLYCSWHVAHDRCNCYFSFWAIFCPFAPITAQKIKIKKNKIKKCLEISSFYTSIPKIMIICYTVPEIQPMTHVIIFHFGRFLPFYPRNSPKNENFKNMKKIPEDIITLHKCAKNHDHMLYCSWDMAHDRHNCYFSFWAIFCPFTPVTTQKMKISKTWKKFLKISSLYISVPKIMIICYTVPEIWRMTDIIVTFHFGLFFALLPL